jgi:hypothetical protein
MQNAKRTIFTVIIGLLLGTLAEGPALADTAPNAIVGVPVAEWLYNPIAISVIPSQGSVAIASATFTTSLTSSALSAWATAAPFNFLNSTGQGATVTWSIDGDASVVFQPQSSTTVNCTVGISLSPAGLAQTGAGSTGYVTPVFSTSSSATAIATMRGVGLYSGTTYTITASIAASGAGCNEVQPPLVKFVLKVRWTTP